MDGQATISVSAATVAITQLLKWMNILPDRWGPVSVLALSAIGVGLWAYSIGSFERAQAFDYFTAWIVVATSAAGVYGFTRAAGSNLTRMTTPRG